MCEQEDLQTELSKLRSLKVVILHDWLTGLRGGERVLESICQLFPEAPLYTLIYNPNSTTHTIENRKIVVSFLTKLPNVHRYYRKLLPLFPLVAQSMKIPLDTDLIISSSHCVIKGIPRPATGKCLHLSYIHSPMRYIYDQFDNYFGPHSGAGLLERLGGKLLRGFFQRWDIKSNQHVDLLVANSEFVRQRIKKFYSREALVANPFVEIKDFQQVQLNQPKKENYFLMVTAFAPNKRVDLAVATFIQQKVPLKIVGSGQQDKMLRDLAKGHSHIQFLGNLPRQQIISLLARARALIFPGIEDFGIVPLEALAAGTPVIAFKSGGVLETLTDDVAVFFEEATSDSLAKAIAQFAKLEAIGFFSDRNKMFSRAKDFSPERFKSNIVKLLKHLTKIS
ncbi:MAG: glycosyltransferase [Oligoflexia bacterium]|nr:glycosyltransferase [Oligoflexia bacterium]